MSIVSVFPVMAFTTFEMLSLFNKSAHDCAWLLVAVSINTTIKVADKEGYASHTPDRSYLWMVQTPQAFSYDLVYGAYEKLFREQEFTGVTDDAMVVERETSQKVKLIPGSYKNIKVTTPEDLAIAELYLKENAGR